MNLPHFVYTFRTFDGNHATPRVGVDVLLPSGQCVVVCSLGQLGRTIDIHLTPPACFGQMDPLGNDDLPMNSIGTFAYFHAAARREFMQNQQSMTVILPAACSGNLRVCTQIIGGTSFLRIVGTVSMADRPVPGVVSGNI